jgi:hypothetical protein
MNSDMHSMDVPASDHEKLSRTGGDDSLWAFFPVLVSLAATCLLTFFFLSPSFEVAEPAGANSARPGAATSVAAEQGSSNEQSR